MTKQESFLSLYPKFRDSAVERILKDNPTYYGVVAGINFLEHPRLGDEVGMLALYDGKIYQTDWYDLPQYTDIQA